MPRVYTRKTLAERFESKVDRHGPVPPHRPELGPCHVWTGQISKKTGYGLISLYQGAETRLDMRPRMAHRVAWFLAYGGWPEPCALHHCDNPQCVRIEHLFEGDDAANVADMLSKGRHYLQIDPGRALRGERNPNSKLTEAMVREIRAASADGIGQRKLGRRYGVTGRIIQQIVRGNIWKHVR